jgi:hypothetical protein
MENVKDHLPGGKIWKNTYDLFGKAQGVWDLSSIEINTWSVLDDQFKVFIEHEFRFRNEVIWHKKVK